MPEVIPIITAAIAAAGVGTSIYGMVNKPSAPAGPTPAEMTKQAVASETANRGVATKEASQFLPMLQSNTSGGLSPEAYDQFASTFSGNANLADSKQMQDLVAKFLGIDTGGSFGGSSSFGNSTNPLSPGLAG